MTHARRRLGCAGEAAAAGWYEARGYHVVARNWRCRAGELDLVVRRGRTIVFVEVKTRSSDRFGLPAEAVTRTKQQRIRMLAARFLDELDVGAGVIRFDVVTVLAGRLEVMEAAF